MKHKLLKIILVIALILLAVYVINLIKSANKGEPIPNTKGSPFEQR